MLRTVWSHSWTLIRPVTVAMEEREWEEPAQGCGSAASDFTLQLLGADLCPYTEHLLLISASQGSPHLWVQYKLSSPSSTVLWDHWALTSSPW